MVQKMENEVGQKELEFSHVLKRQPPVLPHFPSFAPWHETHLSVTIHNDTRSETPAQLFLS